MHVYQYSFENIKFKGMGKIENFYKFLLSLIYKLF